MTMMKPVAIPNRGCQLIISSSAIDFSSSSRSDNQLYVTASNNRPLMSP